MKKTTAKVIQISDILQWHEKGEIELSPKYQRNYVWNEKAKAYLIDTIVRGLPMPPIFLRQKVDVLTKSTFREIIDGQQRLRSIIEFIVEERFAIKKSHNKELGGRKYSDLDEEIQEAILEYEIIAEVVTEKENALIYDMFARLNSNNMVLNKQEIRNSKYWGEFKVYIFRITSSCRGFFMATEILKDSDFVRMKDSEFITSLILVLMEGIIGENPSYIDNVYSKYDKEFVNSDEIENKFYRVMELIMEIYEYLNGSEGCFKNKNYFYTLYCVLVNQMYGLKNVDMKRNKKYDLEYIFHNKDMLVNTVIQFIQDYDEAINDKDNKNGLHYEFELFAKNHKTRTTSKNERCARVEFLNNYFGSNYND